jgi:hypothetical protein
MHDDSLSNSPDSSEHASNHGTIAGRQQHKAVDSERHALTAVTPSNGSKQQWLAGNKSNAVGDGSHTTDLQHTTPKQQAVARPLPPPQQQQQQQQQQPAQTILAKVKQQKVAAPPTPAPLPKPAPAPRPAAAAAAVAASDDASLEALVAKEFDRFASTDDTVAQATKVPMAAAPLQGLSKPSKVIPPPPPPAAAAGAAVGAVKGPARVDPESRLLSKTQPQIMTLMAVEVPMVVKPVHATQGL